MHACTPPQARVSLEEQYARVSSFVAELKGMPIAVSTDEANQQHYEVRRGLGGASASLWCGWVEWAGCEERLKRCHTSSPSATRCRASPPGTAPLISNLI